MIDTGTQPIVVFLTAGEPFKKHLIDSLINYSFKKFYGNFSSVSRTCEPSVSNYLVVLALIVVIL